MFNQRKLINLFHVLIVAPLLWAIATDRLPDNYKPVLLWIAVAIAVYHLWRLLGTNWEGMQSLNGTNMHHIRMFDSMPGYDKPRLVIKEGDIVVWTNLGEVEHTVTAINGGFNSGYLKPSENFTVKFDKVGEFPYHCLHHKGWMKGIIIVQ